MARERWIVFPEPDAPRKPAHQFVAWARERGIGLWPSLNAQGVADAVTVEIDEAAMTDAFKRQLRARVWGILIATGLVAQQESGADEYSKQE